MKMEKFHKSNDAALELPLSSGETVGEEIQASRDEQAALLREQRRKRDELRELARQDEESSQKRINQILGYIRSDDDPRQSAVLTENARQKNQEADDIQQVAQNRRRSLGFILENANTETVLEAQGNFFQRLSDLEFKIVGGDKKTYEQEVLEMLSDDLYEDTQAALLSDVHLQHRQYTLVEKTANSLSAIGQQIFKRYEKHRSGDGQLIAGFLDYNTRLVGDILTKKPEVFKKYPESMIPLIMNIDWEVEDNFKKDFIAALEPIPQAVLAKMLASESQLTILNKLVKFGSKDAEAFFVGTIERDFADMRGGVYMRHFLALPELSKLGIHKLGQLVSAEFGISEGESFVARWQEEEIFTIIDLHRMRDLEAEREGGVALLHKYYGIAEFRRYPIEMLIDQVDQHGKDVPYGLMVFPAEDHNGIFDSHLQDLSKIYEETKGKHLTRIFEADSLTDFARGIVQLRKLSHKAEYLLLGAHGWPDGMGFGKDALTKTTIKDKAEVFDQVRELLAEETRVVLSSCSTGASEGFAQALSEALQREVLAPVIDSINPSLNLTYKNGHPVIDEDFNVPRALYLNGQKIEE